VTTSRDVAILAASIVVSAAVHVAAGEALAHFRLLRAERTTVEFEIHEPPPPAPTPPPPAPVPPPPEPPRVVKKVAKTPPPDLAPPKKDEPPPPPEERPVPRVFGARLEGQSEGGVALPEGNTLNADPNRPRPKEIPKATPSTGAPAPPGQPTGFVPVDDSLIADFPEVTGEVKAPYPPEAEARQIEGTVQVRVEINVDGSVHGARVLKGLGYGLDEAAVRAIRQFRFKPARDRGGRAVPFVIVWRYTFELNR
jgi:periplasmic protein TonB